MIPQTPVLVTSPVPHLTLGQGLETSTFALEILFSIGIGIFGLILFALLIGNIQTYFQSLTIHLKERRIKKRDSKQWMHHHWLPQDLRERVDAMINTSGWRLEV
ncbi:hypothetical protein L3X38_016879 [Prunus dulcis]|uniref:Uncharacterized protein n=1 Tax=Prunus dulcis TaxID=3755 RepID=A0AAD4W668_PRUDU|nr:hypothetical protein L3X38_016879 [Prunus dulcis]